VRKVFGCLNQIPGYITGNRRRSNVNSSQKRAIKNYRSRLSERGLARFEVLGLNADRDLIRSLARRLAEEGPEAKRLRATVSQTISGEPPKKGGILAALRRSPLVGADFDLTRLREEGRRIDI
jgi:transposase